MYTLNGTVSVYACAAAGQVRAASTDNTIAIEASLCIARSCLLDIQ
jgi:hypothetical protein